VKGRCSRRPNQRGERIAPALNTYTKSMRAMMNHLIEALRVKTRGEWRGMTYVAA
jgi:hypothetical protein